MTEYADRHQIDLTTEVMETFTNGGQVLVYNAVDRTTEDFRRILSRAKYFAKQGKHVMMPPKLDVPYKNPAYDILFGSLKGTLYYGKCPDFLVNGQGYEHEGYVTENHKHAIRNMLKHGLMQSDRIIMDKVDLTDNYIRARIKGKMQEGKKVAEVWVRDGENLKLVYKNTNDQPI